MANKWPLVAGAVLEKKAGKSYMDIPNADGLPDGSGKPVKRQAEERVDNWLLTVDRETTAAADLERTAGTGAE